MRMEHRAAAESSWRPWSGSAGEAWTKIPGTADGSTVAFVEAQPDYRGSPHVHTCAEFNDIVEGTVRNQVQQLSAGDGDAATAGPRHDDFASETGAAYVHLPHLNRPR